MHNVHGEVVSSQRRQRKANAARLAVAEKIVAQLRQAAIVAGAEREQRYILTAGIFEKRLPLFCQKLWRFCSYRSVNMSGLAEAAAANAAAEQLEVHSVVNDLG